MHQKVATRSYIPDLEKPLRKKRVAAYARVSTARDESFHSLSAQVSYYNSKISDNPDWEFAGIFSDFGISGTRATREGFQNLLTACRDGKIDMIITKSISRFARNTVILLETIRELKSMDIDVWFEEEGIHSLSNEGELMLSILAAKAQEEARSNSENQKWRFRKNYERGIPLVGNSLGYRLENGTFVIIEGEAKIVREIYNLYLEGHGYRSIVNILNERQVPNYHGNTVWNESTVHEILMNEKYTGDLVLQRFYTSPVSDGKHQVRNRGEQPMYRVVDSHDAIIDRETFDRVQKLRAARREKYPGSPGLSDYCFTNLVRCSICGKLMTRRTINQRSHFPVWECEHACLREPRLISTTKRILDIKVLSPELVRERIAEIVFIPNNRLDYHMTNGDVITIAYDKRYKKGEKPSAPKHP